MTLEVRVQSAASGGLKIIDHIPPKRPCRLEGRNGIGKSALVRLLVLASGVQPYPGQPAPWRSLRSLIGPTEITISGLSGGNSSANLRLTPDAWPEEPVESIGEWLGALTIDGEEASPHRLFELLDVVHLSGTERLIDTFKQQSGRLSVALSDIEDRLNALEDQRAELGELDDELRFVSPREAASERTRLEEVTAQRRDVQSDLNVAAPRAEDLGRATALIALVETGDAAEHQRKLQELRAGLEAARNRLEVAEANHNKAVAALAKGSAAQRKVAKVERRLRAIGNTLDGLLARQEELGGRFESLNIPPDADVLDAAQMAALDDAFKEKLERQRRLQILAARNHRASVENQLVDDVRVVLDDATLEGLGNTVLARVHEQDITVTELRDGLGFLADVDENGHEDLAVVTRELAELSEIKELFVRRTKSQQEAEDLRTDLQRLEPEAAGHDSLRDQATSARAALDAASIEVRAHNVQIGALNRSTLGGSDVVDVEAHIHELLAKHNVEKPSLSGAYQEAQTKVLDLQARDGKLKTEVEHLSANDSRRRVLRETLRRQSLVAPGRVRLRQLAEAINPAILGQDESVDWPDETWRRIADHVSEFRSALSTVVNDISGLRSVAANGDFPNNRLGNGVKAVIAADALKELSEKPIADALFDGGTVRRVSLDDESITWTTPSGEIRTRPLEAFSSGEQALGFMRARLQQIADSPMADRLVFLDEFGAFISADRRRPLADLLTSDELQALSEQVVVILPLQSDYASELDQTTGALREVYTERARSVDQQGYFAEVFAG